jgi:Excalibur calcium-binding domain
MRRAYVAVLSSVEVVDFGLLMIERGAARETGDGYSRQSEYRTAQKTAPSEQGRPAGHLLRQLRRGRKAGAAPLRRGDPGYSTDLDRNGDGVACES